MILAEENRKYKDSVFCDLFYADEDALEHAVRNCIKERILTEYLKRRSGEVINMLMEEYDYDMDIAVKQEEAREESILLAKETFKLHDQGKKDGEIAKILQISEEQVRLILYLVLQTGVSDYNSAHFIAKWGTIIKTGSLCRMPKDCCGWRNSGNFPQEGG